MQIPSLAKGISWIGEGTQLAIASRLEMIEQCSRFTTRD